MERSKLGTSCLRLLSLDEAALPECYGEAAVLLKAQGSLAVTANISIGNGRYPA